MQKAVSSNEVFSQFSRFKDSRPRFIPLLDGELRWRSWDYGYRITFGYFANDKIMRETTILEKESSDPIIFQNVLNFLGCEVE